MSAAPKHTRRRMYQFGLRTMFAIIAIAAAVLAMWRQDAVLTGVAVLLLTAAVVEGPIGSAPPPRP
ncbi:MAG TPA: hypothetical protein VGG64_01325 [Pirellulales bacterium]|jgi:hypothetical protein